MRVFKIVASYDHSCSLAILGAFFQEGIAATKDINHTLSMYQKSAEFGHCCAKYNLVKFIGTKQASNEIKPLQYIDSEVHLNSNMVVPTINWKGF